MIEQDLSDFPEPLCARPIALKFPGHAKPCDRLGPRGDETANCYVMCFRRDAARSVGNHIDVVAVAHRMDRWLCKTHRRPSAAMTSFLRPVFLTALTTRRSSQELMNVRSMGF